VDYGQNHKESWNHEQT